MDVGTIITWREGVMKELNGKRYLAGERVLTGTITRARVSRCGTKDYKIDISLVEGYAKSTVGASVWVKRHKLINGRRWQKEFSGKKDPVRPRRRAPARKS